MDKMTQRPLQHLTLLRRSLPHPLIRPDSKILPLGEVERQQDRAFCSLTGQREREA